MILGLYTKFYGNLGSLSLCCIYYLGEIHADAHRIEGLVRNLLISERLFGLDVLRITYTEHARRKTVTVSELSCTGVFRSQLTSGWQASNVSNFENPHWSMILGGHTQQKMAKCPGPRWESLFTNHVFECCLDKTLSMLSCDFSSGQLT